MSRLPDVIVVGGGVIGCAVTWTLAREGVSVSLLERGELAAQASGAAAGMLAPIAEAATGEVLLRWGLRSLARFPDLVAELREESGIDPEYRRSGILRVAPDAEEADRLRAGLPSQVSERLEWLDADAARLLEPRLLPDLVGAVHSPSEGHVRSPRLVRAFAEAAVRRGARIETGVSVEGLTQEAGRVTGVVTPGGRHPAETVVLCAGAWTSACLARAGITAPPPIDPVRGQIVSVDAPRPGFGSIVWGPGAYLVPKPDGSVVVGATEERVGFDRRVTVAGVSSLLGAAARLVPALSNAGFRHAWAGLRPATPDHLPLIGPAPGLENLVVAAGHHRNGVLLAPVTGDLVRDGLLGKGWREPAFLPSRSLARAGVASGR